MERVKNFQKGFLPGMSPVSAGQQISPAPGVDGLTVYRDEDIPAATKIWIANRNLSGRIFRGPVRTFDIVDDETEITKTVLKSYMISKILDATYLIEVSGVSA